MRGFKKTFARESKMMLKDKRMMTILVAVPVLFTLLFGLIYSEKTICGLRLAVVDHSGSQLSRTVTNYFAKTETFRIIAEPDTEDEALELMENRKIDVLLVIPESFAEDIKLGREAVLLMGANSGNISISSTALTKATEIVSYFSSGITVKNFEAQGLMEEEAYNRMLPLTFQIRNLFNPAVNYSNFLLLGYVAAILQQVVMYFAAVSVTEERRRRTIEELRAGGSTAGGIILGKLLPYFSAGFLTWILCLLIVFSIFSTPMRGSWLLLILLSLAFLFCIVSLSIFISVMARRSIDATQYAMVVALPSFLLCGYTWPLVAMTGFFRALAHVFPITYFAVDVRDIALMDAGTGMILKDMLILAVAGAVFFFLSIARWKLEFPDKKQSLI